MKNKIAIVTGANKGMGLLTTEKLAGLGFHVVMVGRNSEELKKECENLKNKSLSVDYLICDISDKSDIEKLIKDVIEKYASVDVLINNAGIYSRENILNSDETIFENTINTNTIGPFLLMKKIIPLMKKNGFGRIVNVSSQLGSIDNLFSSYFSYSLSKSALNTLTILFTQEVKGFDIKINSICPGWVRTDMGGERAPRSIEEGVSGIIWAATLDKEGPNGGFFRDGKKIDW